MKYSTDLEWSITWTTDPLVCTLAVYNEFWTRQPVLCLVQQECVFSACVLTY